MVIATPWKQFDEDINLTTAKLVFCLEPIRGEPQKA